jgi:ribulose-phosphate 3-epimerase
MRFRSRSADESSDSPGPVDPRRDFRNLGAEIAAATRGGADQVHVDVMDGHFVPNITIGVPVVKSLRKATTLPLDVHLMITDPDRYIERSSMRAPTWCRCTSRCCRTCIARSTQIKKLGAKAGVVLNPRHAGVAIEEVAADVDFVLVMSVNPGFGGQVFIPHSLRRSPTCARCSIAPAIARRSKSTAASI